MPAASACQTPRSMLRSMAREMLRLFASLKLAVLLIAILAAVLAWATFLESAKGRQYAQWNVYHAPWFIGLLGLLAVNVFACTASRFPWGKRRIGFLITHVGLLVLLGGAIATFVAGIDGQLGFEEGETANSIAITDRCQFTATWRAKGNGPRRPGAAFIFEPGPTDWPDGKTLDIGQFGDVAVQVLKFYRHARVEEEWVEDRDGRGPPALKFALAGADGQPLREEWLVADQFGAQEFVGPLRFELQRAAVDSMLEDFLRPPAALDKDGVLSMHYEGKMQRIPVSKSVGKKSPVGDSKVQVEIAEYLPNAKPGSGGKFVSRGSEPHNPLLELRVYLPGKEEPVRQIAFAKLPLLNLDGIHGWNCPVKFWYHHPAVAPQSGVAFFQTSDGELYCRVAWDGKYEPKGAVTQGQSIEIAGQFKVSLLAFLPSARRKVTFFPLELAPGEGGGPEAAALVEVSAGGTSQQFWIQRNHPEYGVQTIQTPEGLLDFRFGYERLPLGFTLRLQRFERGLNPGRMGDASFASDVRLVDPHRGVDEDRRISMNEPLAYGKFRFYQSSYQELPDGKNVSVLSVAYDPGRFLKYLGGIMVCVGVATWLGRRPSALANAAQG